ncbi:MAG: CRTAC1 family protein [Chromatiales bacterium]|jgi:hypothetical protein
MIDKQSPTPPGAGEALIRKVFLRSLAAILVVAALVSAVVLYERMSRVGPEPVEEARITAPRPETQPAGSGGPPPAPFVDITEEAGIRFVHVNGAYGERLMPETIGSGAAFLDYDGDGDQDLFLVNSTYWPDRGGDEATPLQALYRNDGTGSFADVTRDAGLAVELYGMGAAAADYDNDGRTDLFITALGRNRLFHNEGGRFLEVTDQAGVGGREDAWSTAAAFLDYDNDGDLDLYVGNYVKWSPKIDFEIDFRLTGLGRAYGAPSHFVGTDAYLYRNEGDGSFTDVTRAAGISVIDSHSGNPVGKALGVAPVDYDRDGWIDLVVANDTVRNFLFHNRGDGTFEETGAFEGIAYDRNGKSTSGMGIDAAYFRNDADLGVAVGNFANEMTSLYTTADGRGPFADEAIVEGIGPKSRLALTFGVLFFDYDLDGRLDLLQANGHLEPDINKVQPSQTYAQPAQLFWNCGPDCAATFVPVEDSGDLSEPMVGRAATYADIDGDGDLDLLITQNGRRALLFRSDGPPRSHWLRVRLIGRSANRDAIGARLVLKAGGQTQERSVMPARGYLSQVELPVTFGLGEHTRIDELEIHWPGGDRQEVPVDQIDTTLVIEQPETP